MPSMHLKNRKNDVFVSVLSKDLEVCPKGYYLAIVSTEVETANPKEEVAIGIKQLGDSIIRRFDGITETYAPLEDGTESRQFITKSYDSTSHFEYESREILQIYERIVGEPVNMDVSVEEMMAKQRAEMGL